MDIRTATAPKGTRQKKGTSPEIQQPEPVQSLLQESSDEEDTTEDYGDDNVAKSMAVVKKEGLTKDDLMIVLDTLISSGSVKWDTEVLGKMPCVFTAPPTWVADYIQDVIGRKAAENPNMPLSLYNNLFAEYMAASSLSELNGTHYGYTNAEQFEEVYARLVKLPYVLLVAVAQKAVVFEHILVAATSDWLVKNFTKPLQDK